MAITKKALAIRQEKAGLREKHRALFDRMTQACGKVPEAVMRGDATLAAKWRDTAEAAYGERYTLGDSLTVQEINKRVAQLESRLEFLTNPRV